MDAGDARQSLYIRAILQHGRHILLQTMSQTEVAASFVSSALYINMSVSTIFMWPSLYGATLSVTLRVRLSRASHLLEINKEKSCRRTE